MERTHLRLFRMTKSIQAIIGGLRNIPAQIPESSSYSHKGTFFLWIEVSRFVWQITVSEQFQADACGRIDLKKWKLELRLRASIFTSVHWDCMPRRLLGGQSCTRYGHQLPGGLAQRLLCRHSPTTSPPAPGLHPARRPGAGSPPPPSPISLPLTHRPGPWQSLQPRFSCVWVSRGSTVLPSLALASVAQGHTASQGQSWHWVPAPNRAGTRDPSGCL